MMMNEGGTQQPTGEAQLSFWPHLDTYFGELRRRMSYYAMALVIVFFALFPFAQRIYDALTQPLLQQAHTLQIIATHITSPLLVPLKLTFYCALLLTAPILIYELWAFCMPALYQHERQVLRRLFVPALILFYLGMGIAYQWILPLLFNFFIAQAPVHVMVMPEMGAYLTLSMKWMFVFGFCMQVPLLTYALCHMQLLTVARCKVIRPYVIVAAFILGMLLTPPDVVSQIIVAIPICLLFEVGVLLYRFNCRLRMRA